jgi:hypothetical protein
MIDGGKSCVVMGMEMEVLCDKDQIVIGGLS